MHRLAPTLLAVCAISAVVLAGPASVSGAAAKTVVLKDIAFSPKSLSVSRGTTVTFSFRDDGTTHNVVSTGAKRIRSIQNRSSGSVRRTFSQAGVYRYVCTLHPGMTGRITVR